MARYELIAGERRWRAAQIAGLKTIPALVRPHDDAASLELALIENMAREDLNPVEEARACAALVEELGLTREQVGRRVGRGRVAVSNLMRLLDLPDEALELLERGKLSEGHGRALLLAKDHTARRQLAAPAAVEGWSVSVTPKTVQGAATRRSPKAAVQSWARRPGPIKRTQTRRSRRRRSKPRWARRWGQRSRHTPSRTVATASSCHSTPARRPWSSLSAWVLAPPRDPPLGPSRSDALRLERHLPGARRSLESRLRAISSVG